MRMNNRENNWSNFNYEILKPIKLDKKTIFEDFNKSELIYEEILAELKNKLNIIHNTNYSLRAWRIMIGPWLNRYVAIINNRYQIVKHAFQNYPIENFNAKITNLKILTSFDTEDFNTLSVSDSWNNLLFNKIIYFSSLKNKNIFKEVDYVDEKSYSDKNIKKNQRYKFINKIIEFFLLKKALKNKFLFFKTYFSNNLN